MMPASDLTAELRRLRPFALAIAVLGITLCALGYAFQREEFYPSYLTAYLYWLSLSLGCLGVAMIHGMTGGAWGLAIRRVIEAASGTLPLMALLFFPLWIGAPAIYPWADPTYISHHPVLLKKAGYLNLDGFYWRTIAYFVIWIVIAWSINRYSPNLDRDADSPRARALQKVSGLGFMAYGFSFTLAAVDWIMSLEPTWYSTMYGLALIAGHGTAGLSFAIALVTSLTAIRPWSRIVTPVRLNDLGNLLLAAVMFWAYCSFFQYLVIWSGNLPEENSWYVRRSQDGWQYFAISLIVLHFAVPFLLLLSRPLKRNPRRIRGIAILLLAMHFVDLYWIVTPGFQREGGSHPRFRLHWLDPAAFIAVGSVWLLIFAWSLSRRIQMPMFDPELQEGTHERHSAA